MKTVKSSSFLEKDLKFKNNSPNSNIHSNSTSKIIITNGIVSNKITQKNFFLNKASDKNNIIRN